MVVNTSRWVLRSTRAAGDVAEVTHISFNRRADAEETARVEMSWICVSTVVDDIQEVRAASGRFRRVG
jgi:hypothetical protein